MAHPRQKHFMHPQASYFSRAFFFYAYGNTPPTDLLQHVPQDAPRADVLSLGCGDLRDVLYSVLLHGRRPRTVSFVLNDWEPVIHARNLILLQLFLDSRSLLESGCAAELDGITAGVAAVNVQGGERKEDSKQFPKKEPPAQGNDDSSGAAFAQRVGVIFSAMYNMFVDKDVLATIHDVAGRLAASATTTSEWASTELGGLVRFTDDRSRDRVRKILSSYTDGSLQDEGLFMKTRKERASFLATYMPKGKKISFMSRAMGLSSLRFAEIAGANSDMRRQYLKEGILDPFSLLRDEEEGATPATRRGRAKLVNPLLLVTERKGTASSLHYGAFPLDAFSTDVSLWKLRPEGLQGEYGKLAPRVTKHEDINSYIGKDGPSATPIPPRVAQGAWLGTALEQLAQMCGAFLGVTVSQPANTSPAGTRLRIDVHVGDALDFCDALLAVPPTVRGAGGNTATSTPIPPVSFQQATLQPLKLKDDVFAATPPAFDVIKSSNLADHLGIVNVVMASAPLLKRHSQALLLSSYLSIVQAKHMYQDTTEFYEKLLCMNAHTAAVLLGVVPVSSISPVVGHADVTAFLTEEIRTSKMFSFSENPLGPSPASQLRLAWKRPPQALATTVAVAGPTDGVLVDISPDDFVRLVLPVYKAMFEHMPTTAMLASMQFHPRSAIKTLRSVTMLRSYTSASFGRLLVLAGQKLRLIEAHYEAAFEAIRSKSGLILAPNLQQEQVAIFRTLGLAPVSRSLGVQTDSVDTRRVVLLVPKSGILLLDAFRQSEIYLALSGKVTPFDNHFVSVHTAFVRVRRGNSHDQDGHDGWCSLSKHLMVRDAREDDPEAELMVSTLVPTFALLMAPPALTKLELRPRDSGENLQAPKGIIKKLGGMLSKVFYGADLADVSKTAILTPGTTGDFVQGGVPRPRLACPEEAVTSRPDTQSSRSSTAQPVGRSSSGAAIMHRFLHGGAAVDQSIELINQAGGTRLLYRVTLTMGSVEARECLAEGEAPKVEKTLDPCTVRVKLGEGVSHVTSFPFPVRWSSIEMKYSKRQGHVFFTVPPLPAGESKLPFAWTVYDIEGVGHSALPSMLGWSPCPPLASLPRLDVKAEWAHSMVIGGLSFTPAEKASRDGASTPNHGYVDQAFLGLKETILAVASIACTSHNEGRSSSWKHPWMCISEKRADDEPAIWVWVNEILLDSSNEALVLDCCIMPVGRMHGTVSAQLGAAVELGKIRGDGAGVVFAKAHPGEMALWESLLPVAVERARQTYTHTTECTYIRPGGSSWTLCSCGKGKDLQSAFEESMKQVNAHGGLVHPLFYRAALSPMFVPAEAVSAQPVKTASAAPGCGKCGKGGKEGKALMKCTRCHKVAYCSKDCQRLDWKSHKRTCSE